MLRRMGTERSKRRAVENEPSPTGGSQGAGVDDVTRRHLDEDVTLLAEARDVVVGYVAPFLHGRPPG